MLNPEFTIDIHRIRIGDLDPSLPMSERLAVRQQMFNDSLKKIPSTFVRNYLRNLYGMGESATVHQYANGVWGIGSTILFPDGTIPSRDTIDEFLHANHSVRCVLGDGRNYRGFFRFEISYHPSAANTYIITSPEGTFTGDFGFGLFTNFIDAALNGIVIISTPEDSYWHRLLRLDGWISSPSVYNHNSGNNIHLIARVIGDPNLSGWKRSKGIELGERIGLLRDGRQYFLGLHVLAQPTCCGMYMLHGIKEYAKVEDVKSYRQLWKESQYNMYRNAISAVCSVDSPEDAFCRANPGSFKLLLEVPQCNSRVYFGTRMSLLDEDY